MYDDIEDEEIISTAKLPTTSPWIQRGSAVPTRAPRQLVMTGHTSLPLTTSQQLLQAMGATTKRSARRKTSSAGKRAKRSRLADDDMSEGERRAERCAMNIRDDEERSDEEEPSSGDEDFINDDEEDVEEDDSDNSLVSTSDESESDYSEGEAEFSDESSDEEEEHTESSEDDEATSEDEMSVKDPMTAEERAIIQASVATAQITRRLKPLIIMADSHVINIVVCMLWAWHNPAFHGMQKLIEAIPEALQFVMDKKPPTTSDMAVGAAYVWLINHDKLRRNLAENYDSPALKAWLDAYVNADDTPVFVYERKMTRQCFLTGSPCNCGVRLNAVETQTPLATLWFDATDEPTNLWVLNLVRFLFLPATLAEFCRFNVGSRKTPLTEEQMRTVYAWVVDISAEFSAFLFQEGVCKVRTGHLDTEFTPNYVK